MNLSELLALASALRSPGAPQIPGLAKSPDSVTALPMSRAALNAPELSSPAQMLSTMAGAATVPSETALRQAQAGTLQRQADILQKLSNSGLLDQLMSGNAFSASPEPMGGGGAPFGMGGGAAPTVSSSAAPDTVVPPDTLSAGGAVGGGTPGGKVNFDRIRNLVAAKESGGNPNVGYGGVDLSNAPRDDTGFPLWSGNMGPAGISHAAGKYQFQPATWRQYAEPLGIKDFSEKSQDRVFNAAFADHGLAPWAPFNPAIAAATTGSVPPMPEMPFALSPGGALSVPPGAAAINIDPGKLAAARLMLSLGGIQGDPLAGFSQAYYQSPQYLSSKAAAEGWGALGPKLYGEYAGPGANVALQSQIAGAKTQTEKEAIVRAAGIDPGSPQGREILTMGAYHAAGMPATVGGQTNTPLWIRDPNTGQLVQAPGWAEQTAAQAGGVARAQEEARASRPTVLPPGGSIVIPGELRAGGPTAPGPQASVAPPPQAAPALTGAGGALAPTPPPQGMGSVAPPPTLPDIPQPPPGVLRMGMTPEQEKARQAVTTDAELASKNKATFLNIQAAAPNITQGALAEPTELVATYMRLIDPTFNKQVASYENFIKNSETLVREMTRASDSQPAAIQLKMTRDSLPSPSTSPQGLRQVSNQLIGYSDYQIARNRALGLYDSQSARPGDFPQWWASHFSPYTFMVARMDPGDRQDVFSKLAATTTGKLTGKVELSAIGKQLDWLEQTGIYEPELINATRADIAAAQGMPKGATAFRVLDGKTYYKIGGTWY